MATTKTTIPALYRIWFTWADPAVSLLTAVAALLQPGAIINGYLSAAELAGPRNRIYDMLVHQLGGYFLMIALMMGGLLRYTDDVGVWKFVNGAVLCVDFWLLGSILEGRAIAGRLSIFAWTTSDWLEYGLTLWVTGMRIAFIAGVGLGGQAALRKRR